MANITLGGERLGAGKKMKVETRGFDRSTHDLGYIWRSTMASGTLVPFMNEIALPGDSFDIDLDCDIKTHPTIGPLFGSFKVQLDVFIIPFELYNSKLYMNALNIGNKISVVKLPQVRITANEPTENLPIDNQQINPSCIFSYLGMRGVGYNEEAAPLWRDFNAIGWLGYWDIYKNYYANKQEEIGYVIHNELVGTDIEIVAITLYHNEGALIMQDTDPMDIEPVTVGFYSYIDIESSGDSANLELERIKIFWGFQMEQIETMFENWTYDHTNATWRGLLRPAFYGHIVDTGYYEYNNGFVNINDVEPKLTQFPLINIENMRRAILAYDSDTVPWLIEGGFTTSPDSSPYDLALFLREDPEDPSITHRSVLANQEGLAIKTYQSDLFNNWINTEWIDGVDGVNEVTKISTLEGYITIDEINMAKKVYRMLNGIAMSDGTYDSWKEITYDHYSKRRVMNPSYLGGLSKELAFQEVISNSEAGDQPLGTLAGRGNLTGKHKGGRIVVKVDEPSYIMGIISLTPRIDYSQGNKWDVNLKSLDDLHKPDLDQIGFEDRITDAQAWFDTGRVSQFSEWTWKSAGKQPAWINYMTNVNQVRGNFAIEDEQAFMVLLRRYEVKWVEGVPQIKDLTTYIDPAKFNHIFAYTRRDAQNFWAQIKCDITARRKMSAKVMPNP